MAEILRCVARGFLDDYMTGRPGQVFYRQVLPKGQEWVLIGDGTTTVKIFFVGGLDLKVNGDTDVGVQLPRVYLVNGLAPFNLFPLRAVQAYHAIALASTGVHDLGREEKRLPWGNRLVSMCHKVLSFKPSKYCCSHNSIVPVPLSTSPTTVENGTTVNVHDFFRLRPLLSVVQ